MSPITIDRQRKLREIGRIRLGEKKRSSKGTEYPAPLETFRLTSPFRPVLEQAALIYGGEVAVWGDQFQVTTQAASLPVIVPPAAFALTAWLERWTAAGCTHRCDGQVCVTTDPESGKRSNVACTCDMEEPICKPTTRLSVILRELPGIGVWRCETHGWNGWSELESTIEILSTARVFDRLVPGSLRIEKRESKQPGQARHDFVVPVLDLDVTLGDLFEPALGTGSRSEIGPASASQAEPLSREVTNILPTCICGHAYRTHKNGEQCLTMGCTCKLFEGAA